MKMKLSLGTDCDVSGGLIPIIYKQTAFPWKQRGKSDRAKEGWDAQKDFFTISLLVFMKFKANTLLPRTQMMSQLPGHDSKRNPRV